MACVQLDSPDLNDVALLDATCRGIAHWLASHNKMPGQWCGAKYDPGPFAECFRIKLFPPRDETWTCAEIAIWDYATALQRGVKAELRCFHVSGGDYHCQTDFPEGRVP